MHRPLTRWVKFEFDIGHYIAHNNIDSADGPIGSHTQNSERSVLENVNVESMSIIITVIRITSRNLKIVLKLLCFSYFSF